MSTVPQKQPRLISLDVFRGIIVALMILVNSPGNHTAYVWLEHSVWNGFTLADLVFPSFIFIVGVSLAISLSQAKAKHRTFKQLFPKILTRTLILFALGLFLNAFPHHFDLSTLRVFGVLQRIAICYFVAALLFLCTSVSTQAFIMLGLMIIYWLLMTQLPGSYDLSPEGNFAAFIDTHLFSSAHLYGKVFDPEGLLSTIPAISTTLLGNLTGAWLLSTHSQNKKILHLTMAGFFAIVAGWVWGLWFPINKALWTSSYVLWSGGFSLLILALCYWLIEVKSFKKWSRPFELFGLNAMLAYVLHVIFLKIQASISIQGPTGPTGNLRVFITEHLFGWTSLKNASLLYATCYTILWLLIIWLFVIKKSKR